MDPSTQGAAVHELVCECIDRMEREGARVLEELCRQHPTLAERLRARIRALHDAGLLDLAAPLADDAFPERLGDFRLERRIGSGGMGVVFEAWQLSVGRRVALKVVRPEHLYFPGARERFRREVEAVARLSDPGVVAVHAVGDEEGLPFFAMEYVEGMSLGEVIAELSKRAPAELRGEDLRACIARRVAKASSAASSAQRAFSGSWVEACVSCIVQVAASVEHAHQRGVLHRDLKPSNVLVTPAGRTVVVDFGLAAVAGSSRITRTGSQLGSLPYMPPEALAADGRELAAPSDVYSLGVTLYDLCTLRLPFDAASAAALERAIRSSSPKPVRRFNALVPRDLDTIVQKALEPDPARRYASAAALAADLRCLLELRPVSARRTGPLGRARRFVRRRPAAAAAIALAGLIAVGGPFAWLWMERVASAEIHRAESRVGSAQEVAREHMLLMLRTSELLLEQSAAAPLAELVKTLEATTASLEALERDGGDAELLLDHGAHIRAVIARILAQLGRRVESGEIYRALAETCRDHIDVTGPPTAWAIVYVDALGHWSADLREEGRADVALSNADEVDRVLEWLERSPEYAAGSPGRRAANEANRGYFLSELGRSAEARAAFERALAFADQQVDAGGVEDGDAVALHRRGFVLVQLASLDTREARGASALERWTRGLELLEAAAGLDPLSLRFTETLAIAAHECGRSLLLAGDPDAAEPHLHRSQALLEAAARDRPDAPRLTLHSLMLHDSLAILAEQRADLDGARAGFARAAAEADEVVARYPGVRAYLHARASALQDAAAFELNHGNPADARPLFERAGGALLDLGALDALSGFERDSLIWIPLGHALCEILLGELELAIPELERACSMESRDGELWRHIARLWVEAGAKDSALADGAGRTWEERALEALRHALELGWADPQDLETDEAWAPLRELAEFEELTAAAQRARQRGSNASK